MQVELDTFRLSHLLDAAPELLRDPDAQLGTALHLLQRAAEAADDGAVLKRILRILCTHCVPQPEIAETAVQLLAVTEHPAALIDALPQARRAPPLAAVCH